MNLKQSDILKIEHESAFNFESIEVRSFSGVSTDSRTVKTDELFIALRGEMFDGHQFVVDAFNAGAACAVIDTFADRRKYLNKPVLVVKDSLKAFGELASLYRDKFQIPIIAIAGSNGKTTTKEMTAKVLGEKYTVLSTVGNLNNQIGVPQTLFRLKRKHEIAVIEIGTNHFGEIKYLCDILKPTHGVITNIGSEHLEFFKTTEGIARAEGELFDYLKDKSKAFINTDDPHINKNADKVTDKIFFGFNDSAADVLGKMKSVDSAGCVTFSVKHRKKKEFSIKLSVPGMHTMKNALSAAAIGLEFGVPETKIAKALNHFRSVNKRMEILKFGTVTIINDTYNANSDSMISALETVDAIKCKGKKILILGDMLELGDSAINEHKKIGKAVTQNKFDYLLTYGDMSKFIHDNSSVKLKYHYDQKNILAEFASELISKGDLILVKGSRGMKMEDVVIFLSERLKRGRV
ncbi:MAG: UDP-N-acetylmuramoyl-tripeptide--D-alanyl-D-alanine ligase [Ignavibacteriales bacterium]|nr:UDP-N-acetylmuramoyl-tripeptide--D-alanyl-D-alanine ligase [Ignavibacteriales bacterium]